MIENIIYLALDDGDEEASQSFVEAVLRNVRKNLESLNRKLCV